MWCFFMLYALTLFNLIGSTSISAQPMNERTYERTDERLDGQSVIDFTPLRCVTEHNSLYSLAFAYKYRWSEFDLVVEKHPVCFTKYWTCVVFIICRNTRPDKLSFAEGPRKNHSSRSIQDVLCFYQVQTLCRLKRGSLSHHIIQKISFSSLSGLVEPVLMCMIDPI